MRRSSISLWLGRASSARALNDALTIGYSDDGDFLGSPFSRAFKLGRYDDDHREAFRHDVPPRSLELLLKGISYEEGAIGALLETGVQIQPRDNCFVCLYDYFVPPRRPSSWTSRGLTLRRAGVAFFTRS